MLNYEFPPMGGGAGNATDNIARRLAEMGHPVSVITSRFGEQARHETRDGVEIARVFSWRKGIHDCGFRGAYSYLAFAVPRLRRLIRQREFDAIHYFFGLPTGALSLLPGRHRRIPSIVSLRGSDVPYYDEHSRSVHRMNLFLRPVTRRIWRRAGRIVALSDGLREIARRTDKHVRIDVIPNGIETDLFSPNGSRERSSEQPVRLICISRLIKRKGIDHLVQALSGLGRESRWNLRIVGAGRHEGELRKAVETAGLADRVDFHGYCPRTELPELYREADLFVLPSLAESFGMVFAEAMSCGLPILGSRTGGVPELVHEENGILVEPGNVAEITQALRKLISDGDLRRRMGENNRRRVLESYGWRVVAERYLQTYEEVRALSATQELHSCPPP